MVSPVVSVSWFGVHHHHHQSSMYSVFFICTVHAIAGIVQRPENQGARAKPSDSGGLWGNFAPHLAGAQ